MCSPMAVAGASVGVQTLGSYMGQRSTVAAYQEMMDAQAKNAITQMNYNIMGLEQQRTDAFDQAVQQISNTRMNAMQLNGQVKAAVNETMEGRTARVLVRSAEGDTARAVSSIQENYSRKSNELDLNRENQVKSTQSYLENLNASAPKMPSAFSNFLDFTGNALGAYTGAKNWENSQKILNSKAKGGTP